MATSHIYYSLNETHNALEGKTMPKYEVQIQDYSGEWIGYGRYEFLANAVFYAGQYRFARVVEMATGKVVG